MYQIIPRIFCLLAIVLVVTSCKRDPGDTGIEYAPEMYVSIPTEPFTQVADSYSVFKNHMNQQVPPEGTIQRGGHLEYEYANIPADSGKILSVNLQNPIPYTNEVYSDAKVMYDRFCAVCHGVKGDGKGKVAQHDAINPTAYNAGDVAKMTGGQIYHTIMMGKGVMGSYASQVSFEDRWKIVHYVQTLQDPEAKLRKEVEAGIAVPAAPAVEGVEEAPADENAEEMAPAVENHDANADHSGNNH